MANRFPRLFRTEVNQTRSPRFEVIVAFAFFRDRKGISGAGRTQSLLEAAARFRSLRNFISHPILLPVLVVAWLLYAFRAYLPTLFHWRRLDLNLRQSGVYDMLIVLSFAAAASCTGKRILRAIGARTASGAEHAVFSIAVGAMLYSWTCLILSLVHGLYRPVAYTLLILPPLIWHDEMRRIRGELWRALASKWRNISWSVSTLGSGFLAMYVSIVLGVVLVSALGPSVEYDDLTYHLTGPKNFIQNHMLVPLPDVPLVFFPKNIEMLHTLGMLWHCDVTAKLVVFLLGMLTMVAVYGFSARFLSRGSGMIGAAILASSPLFIWEMRTAHNDIGLTLYLFLAVYAVVVWLKSGEASWFRLACLCLAFSMGTKYWAILALGVITLLVFLVRLWQSRRLPPAVSAALKLALYASLGLVPWGLVNLHYTGNPVFPLLNNLFRSSYWTDAHTKMAFGEMFQGGIQVTLSNWWEIFRLPWEIMTDPRGRFGGNIGPWYVIFVPVLFLLGGMGSEVWLPVVFGLLYFAGWAVAGPWVRFLLPALPALAVGAANAVLRLLLRMGSAHRILSIAAGVLLGVFALIASPFFEARGSWSRYGSPPVDTLPLKYLSGRESKDEFLDRNYRGYKVVQFLNGIPGAKKVLYVSTLPDGYYLNGLAAFHYSPYIPGLVGKSADHIHSTLTSRGITHVVVSQPNQQTNPLSSRESDFTHKYLRKLYQRNAHIAYELLPVAVEQDGIFYDFANRLEETNAGSKPPGTPGGAYRAIRTIDNDSRYVLVTAPPSELQFLVRIPEGAVFSVATGKGDPGCNARGSLKVWTLTPSGDRQLVSSRDLESNGYGWSEHRVDLAEYAGRQAIIMLNSEERICCCDYFWADPVLTGADSLTGPDAEPRDMGEARQTRSVISGCTVDPAKVTTGQPFRVTFSGPSLTSDTYFDIRFRAPYSGSDQVVPNWQKGPTLWHATDPATKVGRWVITGIRAHQSDKDYQGEFIPVWVVLDVVR